MLRAKPGTPGIVNTFGSSVEKLIWQLQRRVTLLHQTNAELTSRLCQVERDRAHLRSVFDAAPIGYCVLDGAGKILEANPEAIRQMGQHHFPGVGGLLVDAFEAEARDVLNQFLAGVTPTDRSRPSSVQLKVGEGAGVLRVRSTALASGAAHGAALRLVTLEDATELCALRERESRFRQIAAHVEDVYYETDETGRLLYLSSGYDFVWHRAASEVTGQHWFHALHVDDRARANEARRLLLKGDPFDEEYRIVRPNGEIRWVRDRAFLVDAPTSHVVGVARDVTDDRDLEEELRQSQKLEALGTLASSVAHDFGNLLQGVMGCLSIALGDATTAERSRDYTYQALMAVRGGASLVGELMKFGRKDRLHPRAIAIDTAIAGCAKLLQRLLGDHIRLCIETRAPRTSILADPVQVEQILMNLAANARDAMPGGGRLVIRTGEVLVEGDTPGQPRPFLRLEVTDIGCGMDLETQTRVFEPFFTTKAAGKGTGLGLSAVRAVTRALGGQVTLDSEVGKGTSFVFRFPAVPASPVLAPGGHPDVQFAGRALLVDDDWRVRISVRQYLEELGFEVVEAADAGEALARAKGAVGLLVTDVILPEVSGPRIRALLQERYPELKVLYISAHPAPYLTEHGLLEANDMMLQKPFELHDLAFRLSELYSTTFAFGRRRARDGYEEQVAQ